MISVMFAAALLLADANAAPAGASQPVAAPAASQPAAAAPATPTKGAAKDDLVCRQEPQLGSKFTRKVCRSRASMALRGEEDRRMVQQMQREVYGGHAR